jgi:hypothetical protein
MKELLPPQRELVRIWSAISGGFGLALRFGAGFSGETVFW